MTTDRQTTNPSHITPMVSVDDVEQAVAFYKQLGFHSSMEIKGPNGKLVRAILQLGSGFLIHVMPAHALPEEGEHGIMIERGPSSQEKWTGWDDLNPRPQLVSCDKPFR